jgi:hypothetical protein
MAKPTTTQATHAGERGQATPGPWFTDYSDAMDDDNDNIEIRDEEGAQRGRLIATVHMQGERTQANARLIAAAPQMREALAQALAFVVDGDLTAQHTVDAPRRVTRHDAVELILTALRAANGGDHE